VTLSDANAWFGILGGAVGALSFLYLIWDSLKKRRRLRLDESAIVTTNAIQLMEQLRRQADDLGGQVADLQGKLRDANQRADDLEEKHDSMAEALVNAQSEVRVLRVQVKHLSAELDKYTGGSTPA
jgi:chromosome segregation ATPase